MNDTSNKADTNELAKILNDSKLELSESEQIKQSYLPYFEALGKIKDESAKINFDNPTELDEQIARSLRIRTMKVRTGSLAVKDERKRIHMLKANVEQDAWNLIKSTCLLDEERFEQVEKKREFAEKARKIAQKDKRLKLLIPYEVDTTFVDLLNMGDDVFDTFLLTSKNAYDFRIAEAKRLEEEEIQRQKVAEENRLEMVAENTRLRAESEAKEKALAQERAKVEAERKAAQEKQDAELKAIKAKAEAERKEADNKARIEREAAELKAKEEKAKQDAILEKERQERIEIEKELANKKEAEAKAKSEAEAAAEAELSKGDAAKIADLIKDLEGLQSKYVFKSKKNQGTYSEVKVLLNKIITHITTKTK